MEKTFASGSIITVIVLCVIGIVKILFKNLKATCPKLYKALFTLLSIIVSFVLCVVNELYVLKGELLSIEFGVLCTTVIAGVFCGYGGVYEGLGIKELVKIIIENIKKINNDNNDNEV